jgi:hypothetical protein
MPGPSLVTKSLVMKVNAGLKVTLLGIAALPMFAAALLSQQKEGPQCTSVALSFVLQAGDNPQKPIGDLTFKFEPLKSTGWIFSFVDAKDRDFIYPVNPPLRFNGSQTLGAGYGETAKQSLSYGRELHFLLNGSDYDAFWPVVEQALWPATAPDPDQAADKYFRELDKLRTGLLRLAVVRTDISDDDQVRSAEFRIEFIAPKDYQFLGSLGPHPVACPSDEKHL